MTSLPGVVRVLSDEVGVIGGAAKATLLLCEALSDAGAEVFLHVTTSPGEEAAVRLTASRVRCVRPPLRFGSRFRLPARLNGLRAWLAMRRSPDTVLHAVGMQHELSQYLAMPGRSRVFVWETTEALPGNKFIQPKVRSLLGKIEKLLVPSHAVERNARATYGYTGRTALLPFWVDDRAKGRAHPATADTPRLLFVGRMDEDKGFRFLVPAFEQVRNKLGNVGLDVCGSGNPGLIPELRRGTAGLEAHGSIGDEELDMKFSRCVALVLPSLHEGYPLTLLEACSFGKPVIASSVGSIPEVFANRACAILVPPGDVDALAAAMLQLLEEDGALYAMRCADARRLFEELCSKTAVIEALSRAYDAS